MDKQPDLNKSVEELAAEVVQLPDGTDLEKESGLRPLLISGIKQNINKYADVFELAATSLNLSRTRYMELACTVEVVNARRRNPDNPLESIAEKANVLANSLATASDFSTDERMLLGKLNYNLGLIERMRRNYDCASLYQQRSAAHYFAAGKSVDALVALFVAAAENASDAIVSGDVWSSRTQAALDHLVATEALVRGAASSYPVWMKENAALHIVWAKIMAAVMVSGKDLIHIRPVTEAEFAAALSTTYVHWKTTMELVKVFGERNYTEVVVKVQEALNQLKNMGSSSIGNTQLTWKILAALSLINLGKKEEARALLSEVTSYAGPDGGVPMAVASRCLKQI